MPEDQNFNGAWWNERLNAFLTNILGWTQLGTSNVDVACDREQGPLGLDSVFAYRPNDRSRHSVILVEAKFRGDMRGVSRADLQSWVNRLLEKMEKTASCPDFLKKFAPPPDADLSVGLLAIWINSLNSFEHRTIISRLKQVELPEKHRAQIIFVLDNYIITRFIAVHQEIGRLHALKECQDTILYSPALSSDLRTDGKVVPIEYLFSDIIFYKTTRLQYVKGRNESVPYDAGICFYFGGVRDQAELKFIELAVRDLGLQCNEFLVYITSPVEALRSEIEAVQRESQFDIEFRKLDIAPTLPSSMER